MVFPFSFRFYASFIRNFFGKEKGFLRVNIRKKRDISAHLFIVKPSKEWLENFPVNRI